MSQSVTEVFTLNTGASIPALGLGTWKSQKGQVLTAVTHALVNAKIRHIDCAWLYGNEDEVGQGLKQAFASGIRREDVFITSKLWCTYHTRVEEGLDLSLKSLGVEYLDLYLMHWPVAMNPQGNNPVFPTLPDGTRDVDKSRHFVQTYKDMEKLLATGKVKAIGVSNYSVKFLKELLAEVDIVPAVNQIELHPSLPQLDLVEYCHQKGIHLTAYSPFGSTGASELRNSHILDLAMKHNVKPGTIVLSYIVQKGLSAVPKSVTPARIEQNNFVISLEKGDVQRLDIIDGRNRILKPNFGVDFGFPDWQP